ncbi:unnamed protein product [Cuscuta epithymum]|uniref:DUF223 domain-containing protein n=1 Tax=Cuscuta epithymum TaxID=186058 RepID=A0AAV0CAF3_9ASTE|nr:unnamed protein product [Cuscuta epithymum]
MPDESGVDFEGTMVAVKLPLAKLTMKVDKRKAIIVRVLRKWVVPYSETDNGTKFVELLLEDDEGDRIQATVEQPHVPIFDDQIEEGGVYAINLFTVQSNVGPWRPCSHAFRLYFTENTKIKQRVGDKTKQFKSTPYKLKSFSEIQNSPEEKTPDLFDVIGAYDPRERPFSSTQGEQKKKWCNFYIRDLENMKMHCTLWENHAETFMNYLKTPRTEAVIVLLQLCRVNTRWGGGTKGISSSFYATKMLIDEHIPEIEEFRARFAAMRNPSSRSNSETLSGISSHVDGIEIGTTKKLSELATTNEIRGCWFYAKVKSIINIDNWSYLSCFNPKCYKKVTGKEGNELICKCGLRSSEGIWCYLLKLKVEHKLCSAEVVFWDRECKRLLGKDACEFSDHLNTETFGPKSCPEEIKQLIGKEFIFKIDREAPPSVHGKVYYLGGSSDNMDKIREIKSSFDENSESEEEGYNSDYDLDLLDDDAPTPVESNMTVISEEIEDVKSTPQSLSKRPSEDEIDCVEVGASTQGSTTKKLKAVKIEKP